MQNLTSWSVSVRLVHLTEHEVLHCYALNAQRGLPLRVCRTTVPVLWILFSNRDFVGGSRMVVKQFKDGGRPSFWKSIYRHISEKNHPILMKFCTQQQILNWMNVTWSKMKISIIQDGGRPPFWKSLYRHISVNKKLSCRRETDRRFVSLNI